MVSRVKKQAMKRELDEIAARERGNLEPQAVVDRARDPNNVLHDSFEWDDSIAGEKYRLEQARALITTIYVTVSSPSGDNVRTLAYIRNPSKPSSDQGYKSITLIRDNAAASRKTLSAEVRSVIALFDRAHGLAKVFGYDKKFGKVRNALSELLCAIEKP